MSTVLEQRSLPDARGRWGPWLAVAAGLLLLYVPTYVDLARGLWRDDAYAHGPIILAVFAWLAWRGRDALLDESSCPARGSGAMLLVAGLVLYVIGRSQSLAPFEVGSHLPVIAGAVLMLSGPRALRRLAFPLLFLLFLVPLPGFVLDAVTMPLKEIVSAVVETILRAAGYPIERAGVVLDVGGHEMLVADACSGLNSLYSLLALGLLYAHLTAPSSRARMALLCMAVVPIAIVANVLRVTALVLITYYLGEDVAQGFLHGFAGIMVFVVALWMLMAVDKLIRAGDARREIRDARLETREKTPSTGHTSFSPLASRVSWPAYLAGVLMLGAALAAPALKPVRAEGTAIDLEKAVPTAFGDWRIDAAIAPVAPAPDVQAKLDRIYRQIVNRTYVNSRGEQMMLTIAHGGDQSDALKAHRQEACYKAQGFEIESLAHGELSAAGRTLPVTRMLAVRGERSEPVTYWFTMGDRVVLGRVERLRVQLAAGLAGRIPDGMLVRVSNLSTDAPGAFAAQQSFAAAAFAAMPPGDAVRFIGAAPGRG